MNDPHVNPIPDGMRTVTPHLVCRDANSALDWYKTAFGAVETSRLPGADGQLMHGAMTIGDSTLMLAEEWPQYRSLSPKALNGSPVVIHLYVPDVDASVARAVDAGATVTMPVTDMFWGDRYGTVEDPYGHRWSIATHTRDVTPDEMREAMANMG